MEKSPKGYIEQILQKSRNSSSDYLAEVIILEGSVMGSQTEHAKYRAQLGDPSLTASFLYRGNNSPTREKGEILATAYSRDAEEARKSGKNKRAQRSEKIAQRLRQTVQRTEKS